MRPAKRAILPYLACLLTAVSASGQLQTSYDAQMQAELIGVLTQTRLSVEFDGVPAREAFRSVSAALATPVVGRYSDDRFGHGIDPAIPVTFRIDDAPARLILEMILEQCASYEPCTWQLRKGYIEVGTKDRLSFPSAVETRVYTVAELLLEAPYFTTRSWEVAPVDTFDELPYSTAALTRPEELQRDGRPFMMGPFPFDPATARKHPEMLLKEIAQGIVGIVEPGNWDWGQEDEREQDPHDGRTAGRATLDKIARLRIWEDRLIIAAPDFIHRQVGGYPKPIQPDPLTESERQERSTRATSEAARVTVISVRGSRRP